MSSVTYIFNGPVHLLQPTFNGSETRGRNSVFQNAANQQVATQPTNVHTNHSVSSEELPSTSSDATRTHNRNSTISSLSSLSYVQNDKGSLSRQSVLHVVNESPTSSTTQSDKPPATGTTSSESPMALTSSGEGSSQGPSLRDLQGQYCAIWNDFTRMTIRFSEDWKYTSSMTRLVRCYIRKNGIEHRCLRHREHPRTRAFLEKFGNFVESFVIEIGVNR